MQADGRDKTVAISNVEYRRDTPPSDYRNHRELPDEELARLFVRNQDENAFNEIVDRYGDKIYRLALRITHSHNDAEDVLQEVFVTLLEKIDTFREESRFSTWLYRVAANASYMHLRAGRKKHENEVVLDDYRPYNESGNLEGVQIKDWSDRPDDVILSREGIEIIEKAVNELPIPYRVVFHLRDVEGLTNQEVAKVLGLSLPAVKSRILRARLFLRDRLSDYFYELRK
ncbi:MAG TPA: sigma-70 family RNA polymerase sigma factor [Thermodesulfobacteriota bacterium]|jgi:RNA polymerase sigma-70 factor (ECF subfamily)|nr:sigma-70 family RNA polymerase sigma factor [Thermodesulfobacteriota bacterium]